MATGDKHRTISMQLDAEYLARVDANALAANGGNRTQYILSWLPETYDQPAAPSETKQQTKQTAGR